MLTEEAGVVITDVFKNRWRTLMSVDDVIADVFSTCVRLGVVDNTYFFYSSDHGFQLGEFNIAMDKRHVYDWDTRIHLLAVGPGISKGSTFSLPATQVDLAPTFLGIAGLAKPATMDGKSLLPLLTIDTKVTATAGQSDDNTEGVSLPVPVAEHIREVTGGSGKVDGLSCICTVTDVTGGIGNVDGLFCICTVTASTCCLSSL